MRISALVPNAVTKENSLKPPSAYLALGDDLDRVAGPQRNIAYNYSTEWEMHEVQEPSAEEEELKRLQTSINSRRAALMAGRRNPLTSTPNPNLSNQKQTVLNSYVQHFAPASSSTTTQPWSMSDYTTTPQTPLFGTTYGRTIGGTVPTSAPQIQSQTQFRTSQFGAFTDLEASGTQMYIDSKISATT